MLPLFEERLKNSGIDYKLNTTGVEQEDWETAWKQYYHAMDIGERLAIVPGWEDYQTDRIKIIMDPGMAFGTGTHETTSLCLEDAGQPWSRAGSACSISVPAPAFWPLPH